ncbi:MAG: hypothetical protein R2883_04700 [Caldisericia bacterium]
MLIQNFIVDPDYPLARVQLFHGQKEFGLKKVSANGNGIHYVLKFKNQIDLGFFEFKQGYIMINTAGNV